MVKRITLISALVAITALLGISEASAHTVLVAASPSKDSVLTVSPHQITLRFAEALLTLSGREINRISLFDPHHKSVALGRGVVKSTILSATVPAQLTEKGLYLVKYRVTADDGHVVNGYYTFTLKN